MQIWPIFVFSTHLGELLEVRRHDADGIEGVHAPCSPAKNFTSVSIGVMLVQRRQRAVPAERFEPSAACR